MRDSIEIGSGPHDEDVAQVGQPDYPERSRAETAAYVRQLRRVFGPEPEGARLTVKSFQHDFGSYREVVCTFDDSSEEAVSYCFKIEGEAPGRWDEEAVRELRNYGQRGPTGGPQGVMGPTGSTGVKGPTGGHLEELLERDEWKDVWDWALTIWGDEADFNRFFRGVAQRRAEAEGWGELGGSDVWHASYDAVKRIKACRQGYDQGRAPTRNS